MFNILRLLSNLKLTMNCNLALGAWIGHLDRFAFLPYDEPRKILTVNSDPACIATTEECQQTPSWQE